MVDRIAEREQIRSGAVGREKRREQVGIHYIKDSYTAPGSQRAFVYEPAGVAPVMQNRRDFLARLERNDQSLVFHVASEEIPVLAATSKTQVMLSTANRPFR